MLNYILIFTISFVLIIGYMYYVVLNMIYLFRLILAKIFFNKKDYNKSFNYTMKILYTEFNDARRLPKILFHLLKLYYRVDIDRSSFYNSFKELRNIARKSPALFNNDYEAWIDANKKGKEIIANLPVVE